MGTRQHIHHWVVSVWCGPCSHCLLWHTSGMFWMNWPHSVMLHSKTLFSKQCLENHVWVLHHGQSSIAIMLYTSVCTSCCSPGNLDCLHLTFLWFKCFKHGKCQSLVGSTRISFTFSFQCKILCCVGFHVSHLTHGWNVSNLDRPWSLGRLNSVQISW